MSYTKTLMLCFSILDVAFVVLRRVLPLLLRMFLVQIKMFLLLPKERNKENFFKKKTN